MSSNDALIDQTFSHYRILDDFGLAKVASAKVAGRGGTTMVTVGVDTAPLTSPGTSTGTGNSYCWPKAKKPAT